MFNINKKSLKKTKLTAEELAEQKIQEHWKQAEQKSKKLIDQFLNRNLPANWRPQDLNLEKSSDWRVIAREDAPYNYEDRTLEELPTVEYLAEKITYHYLLTIIERFFDDLSEYNCHDKSYFEDLIQTYY